MITKFKIFETLNLNGTHLEKLKDGDYVILSFRYFMTNDKLENKIGRLIRVRRHYDEIDIDFGDGVKLYGTSISNVKYWSSDKEELETFIAAKKYNM